MIREVVNSLIDYASIHLGLEGLDRVYARNIVLGELGLEYPSDKFVFSIEEIEKMEVPDYFIEQIEKYLKEEKGYSDKEAELKAVLVMGVVTPSPEEVVKKFEELRKFDSARALDYLYNLGIKNYYFQKTMVDKNIVWKTDYKNKNIEVSINLSKPEKSNKDIAKLLEKPKPSDIKYPKCLLCLENIGFYGNDHHPARENIRFVPVVLDGEMWYLQYSPYGYYYKHCICFSSKHSQMVINESTFKKLVDFVDVYPSFFIGSNADLPIVGGSILNHEHFQGGEHILPVMEADIKKEYKLKKYQNTKLYKLDWYNSTLLIKGKDRKELVSLASEILNAWRTYDDLTNDILSSDANGKHNTITPSIRKIKDEYYLYLILRNNRCDEKYPEGIFHAHPEYHHIKKEGIGIIEAMGLFILPARLVRQENEIKDVLSLNLDNDQIIKKYSDLKDFLSMIELLRKDYNSKTIDKQIKEYIEDTCKHILMNTAVFKDDKKGNEGLDKFIGGINL